MYSTVFLTPQRPQQPTVKYSITHVYSNVGSKTHKKTCGCRCWRGHDVDGRWLRRFRLRNCRHSHDCGAASAVGVGVHRLLSFGGSVVACHGAVLTRIVLLCTYSYTHTHTLMYEVLFNLLLCTYCILLFIIIVFHHCIPLLCARIPLRGSLG